MDSGNSSSMQSSSGGDEEYDSRADQSLSAFLDHPHHHSGPSPAPPPPPPPPRPHNHHHQQFHFDTSLLSNYFHTNPLSSSSSFSSPSFLPGSDPTPQPGCQLHFSSAATSSLSRPLPPPQPSHHQSTQRNPGGGSIKNNNQIGPVVKNPKKRSRASRRAPTTVLTTDTSNFRSMVQEFTGIPAPLFTNNINTRLNSFFGLSPSSSYNLLRPFAQKLAPTPNSINQQISNSSCSTSTDFYQNHLNLQSLLQDPIRNQVTGAAGSARNDHTNVRTSVSLVEEFGLGGIQNTVPPSNNTATVTAAMLCRRESTGNSENGGYNDGDEDHNNIINPLRLMTDVNNGGRDDDSSAFQGENRGLENVTATTRNEGTIESWLCSSSSDQRS